MLAKLSPTSVPFFTILLTYYFVRNVQATFRCSREEDKVTVPRTGSVLIHCILNRELKRNEQFILEKRNKTSSLTLGICFSYRCYPNTRHGLVWSKHNKELIVLSFHSLNKSDLGQYYAAIRPSHSSTWNDTLVLTVVPQTPTPACETILMKDLWEFEFSCEWAVHDGKGTISTLSSGKRNHTPGQSSFSKMNSYGMEYHKIGNRTILMFSLTELVTSKALPDTCVVKTTNENAERGSCKFPTPVLDLQFHELFPCEHSNESDFTVWVLNDLNLVKLNSSEPSFIDGSKLNENKTLIICGKEEYGKIYVNRIERIVSDENGKCNTVRVGNWDQVKAYNISTGCASNSANDNLSFGYSGGSTVGYTSTKVSTPVTQGTRAVHTSSATIDPNSDTDVSKSKESGIIFFAVALIALVISIGTFLYIVFPKLCTNRKASVPFHENGGNYHRHSPTPEMTQNEESIATPQLTSQLSIPTTDIQLPLFLSDSDAVNFDNRSRQPRDRCPTLPPRVHPGSPRQITTACHLLPERNFSSNTLPCVKENTKGDFFPTGHHEEESTNRTKQNIDCAAVDEGSTDALTSFDNIYNTVDDIQNKLKSAAAVDILNKHDSNSPCLLLTASANPQDLSNAVDGNNLEERPTIRFQKASLPLASSEDIDRLYAKPKKNITLEQPSFFSTPTNTTPLRPGEDDNIEASSSPSDYEELRQSKP